MFRFCVFTGRVRRGTTSGGGIFLFYVFTGILFSAGPSGTPSFVARRKIGEKGVPRRRKLHILRFAFRGKSSVVPLLLLSPPNPLRWALAGAPVPKPPFGIWLFYTGVRRGDVLTSYGFAVMHFTRFRPARRRAGGVCFTRLRRKAKHHLFSAISLPKALLPPDSIVLLQLRRIRWH